MWQRVRLRLNASKTRVWNAAGVWVGDLAASPEQRGLTATGVPIFSRIFLPSMTLQPAGCFFLVARRRTPVDSTASHAAFRCGPRSGSASVPQHTFVGPRTGSHRLPQPVPSLPCAMAALAYAVRRGMLPPLIGPPGPTPLGTHPSCALVDTLDGGSLAPEALQSALLAPASLSASGYVPSTWSELLSSPPPHPPDVDLNCCAEFCSTRQTER